MALENGKHSYAEKPMAVNFEDGKKLLELSKEKNLYIGNAPDTFLGGGIQKTRELIDNGVIDEYKTKECLIIDDFNNNIEEKLLYSIINAAVQDNKYLIISSSVSLKKFKIKGGCQSGIKVVTHVSKSALPVVQAIIIIATSI